MTICPWCGVGKVSNREYMLKNGNPGEIVRFARCDNNKCNVEWLASETATYWRVIDGLVERGIITLSEELKERRTV